MNGIWLALSFYLAVVALMLAASIFLSIKMTPKGESKGDFWFWVMWTSFILAWPVWCGMALMLFLVYGY